MGMTFNVGEFPESRESCAKIHPGSMKQNGQGSSADMLRNSNASGVRAAGLLPADSRIIRSRPMSGCIDDAKRTIAPRYVVIACSIRFHIGTLAYDAAILVHGKQLGCP